MSIIMKTGNSKKTINKMAMAVLIIALCFSSSLFIIQSKDPLPAAAAGYQQVASKTESEKLYEYSSYTNKGVRWITQETLTYRIQIEPGYNYDSISNQIVVLGGNIDLSNIPENVRTNPQSVYSHFFGNPDCPYIFDGNGYTVTGPAYRHDINSDRYFSFYSNVSTGKTVKDTKFVFKRGTAAAYENSQTDRNSFFAGIAGENYGTITNCSAQIDYYIVNDSAAAPPFTAGGIVGNNHGTVTACSSSGNLYLKTPVSVRAGGIAARASKPVKNSTSSLNIKLEASSGAGTPAGSIFYQVGGIVADVYAASADSMLIENCEWTGSIDVKRDYAQSIFHVGGIAGIVYRTFINGCKATGNITVRNELNAAGDSTIYAGGIAGNCKMDNENIYSCIYNGTVSVYLASTSSISNAIAGGIAGRFASASDTTAMRINNCSVPAGSSVLVETKAARAVAGGIAGEYNGSEFAGITSEAAVSARAVSGQAFAGGIAGKVYGQLSVAAFSCSSTSPVTVCSTQSAVYAGGFAGYADSASVTMSGYSGTVTVPDADAFFAGGLVGACGSAIFGNVQVIGTMLIENGTYGDAGGLVGYAETSAYFDSCKSQMNITVDTSSADVLKYINVGGIVGRTAASTTISYSDFTGTSGISVTTNSCSNAGGIAGHIDQGTINACYNTGRVDVSGIYNSSRVGGIVGMGGFGIVNISKSYSSGPLSIKTTVFNLNLGGIAGYLSGSLTKCFSVGTLTADLAKTEVNNYVSDVGGLVGYAGKIEVLDCYSAALIDMINVSQAILSAGGLLGSSNIDGTIRTSYSAAQMSFDGALRQGGTKGNICGAGNGALKPADAQQVTAYYTAEQDSCYGKPATNVSDMTGVFDLDSIWTLSSSGEYSWPVLKGIYAEGTVNIGDIFTVSAFSGMVWRPDEQHIASGPDACVDSTGVVYRLDKSTFLAEVLGFSQSSYQDYIRRNFSVVVNIKKNFVFGQKAYTVASIADSAFARCLQLKRADLSDGIKRIGNQAFDGCTELSYLILSKGVEHIGSRAFARNPYIDYLTFGNSLVSIGEYAFSDCTGLYYVTFGKGLAKIAPNAFNGSKLLSATFLGDIPKSADVINAFANVNNSFKVKYSTTANGWGNVVGYSLTKGWVLNAANKTYDVIAFGEIGVATESSGKWQDEQGIEYTKSGNYAILRSGINYKGYNEGSVLIPLRISFTGDSKLYDVTLIDGAAFANNTYLKNITLPATITEVGASAFSNCTKLELVVFKGNAPTAGTDVFKDAKAGLHVVYRNDFYNWQDTWGGRKTYESATLSPDKRDSQNIIYTLNSSALTAMVGTTAGGDNRTNSSGYVGANNGSVRIPEYVSFNGEILKVSSMDAYAFFNNASLRTLYFGRAIELVYSTALRNTGNLESITVHSDSQFYFTYGASGGAGALYQLTALRDGNPDNDKFKADKLVKLPEKFAYSAVALKVAGEAGRSEGKPVLLDVVNIDKYAASNTKLKTVDFSGVQTIGESGFENSDIENALNTANITIIEKNAFFGCDRLKTFNITTAATGVDIQSGAFQGCASLESFTGGNPLYFVYGGVLFKNIGSSYAVMQFPESLAVSAYSVPSAVNGLSVTAIGDRAFGYASSLTKLITGDNITEIGLRAFIACRNLQEVYIGKGVAKIGGYPFQECLVLNKITVDALNVTFFSDVNGVLYCGARLIAYPAGLQRTSFTVGSHITEIEPGAFSGTRALLRVIIPESVTEIGNDAFAECNRLKNAYFKGVPPSKFGKYVFDGTDPGFVINYREFLKAWGAAFAGYPTAPYNAISELPNDAVDYTTYTLFVVDSFGQPKPDFLVTVNGLPIAKATNEFGMVNFLMPQSDTVSLKVTHPDFFAYENDNFSIDKAMGISYITMVEMPTVMGVSAQGRDINSQTAKINLSKDNVDENNKMVNEYVTIVVDGFCANNWIIKEFTFIQDDLVILTDNNGTDGFKAGKYSFMLHYSKFIPDKPVFVRMKSAPDMASSDIVTLLAKLNIDVYVFDVPNIENIVGDSFKVTTSGGSGDRGGVPLFGGLTFEFEGGIDNFSFIITEDEIRIGLNFDIIGASDLGDDIADLLGQALAAAGPQYGRIEPNDETGVELSIGGYIILKYSSAGVVLQGAEIRGHLAFVFHHTQTFAIIPVVLEATLKLEADVTLQLNIIYDTQTRLEVSGDLTIQGTVTLKAGVGYSVMHVGIYGMAIMVVELDIPSFSPTLWTLGGELGVYLKVDLGLLKFTYLFPLIEGTWVIYSTDPDVKSGYSTPFSMGASYAHVFNELNYTLMTSDEETQNVSSFRIIECGGTLIKVFISNIDGTQYDNGGYDAYNYSKLMYSVYDNSLGEWAAPAVLDDNGLSDGEYDLSSDGTDIYIAYSQANRKLKASDAGEGLGSAPFASTLDIKAAKWDFVSKTWTGITLLSPAGDNTYDFNPKLTVVNGKPTVTWLKNTDNNLFGLRQSLDESNNPVYELTDANSLWYSTLTDGVWSAADWAAEKLNTVAGYAVNSDGTAAIIVDLNCDFTTRASAQFADDKMIYKFLLNSKFSQDAAGGAAVFGEPGAYEDIRVIEGRFVYMKDALLYFMDGGLNVPFLGAANIALPSGFKLIYSGGEKYAVIYSAATENNGVACGAVYGILYDSASGKWGAPLLLQKLGAGCSAQTLDASVGTASITLYCLETSDNGEESKLVSYVVPFKPEIALTDVSINYADANAAMNAGDDFNIYLSIKNNSLNTLSSILLDVTAPDGTKAVDKAQVAIPAILPGCEGVATYLLSGAGIQPGVYAVKAYLENEETLTDNEDMLVLGYSDIKVTAKHVLIGGADQLVVNVKNNGYLAASGTLYVIGGTFDARTDGSPEGHALFALDVSELSSGDSKNFLIELDDYFYANKSAGVVTVYFASSQEEHLKDNNHCRVSVESANGKLASEPASEQVQPAVFAQSGKTFYHDPVLQGGADLVLLIAENGNGFAGINGLTASDYTVGAAYSLEGVTVKPVSIKNAYLASQAAGVRQLLFEFENSLTAKIIISIIAKKYTVIWNVGANVHTEEYAEGALPSFKGAAVKIADDLRSYTFTGWQSAAGTYTAAQSLPAVTGDIVYTAQFSETTQKYTVYFIDSFQTFEPVTVDVGTVFSGILPSLSGAPGYEFTHWETADGAIVSGTDSVAKSVYLYSIYTIAQVTDFGASANIDKTYDGTGTISVAPSHVVDGVTFSYAWEFKAAGGEFRAVEGAQDSSLSVKNVAQSGAYRVTVTASDGIDTAVSHYDFTVRIAKKTLTVTAVGGEREYNTGNPIFSASCSGFAEGETLSSSGITGSLSFTCSAAADSDVGLYDVMPSGLTSENYSIVYASGKLNVTKATYAAPVSGSVDVQKTSDSITVSGTGLQFSINGGAFTSSGSFTDLTPFTVYTVSAKRAGDGNHFESAVYIFNVSTEKGTMPSAPEVSATLVQDDCIVLSAALGAEYSIDNGVTWQDSNTFTGLTSATMYNFVVRLKGNAAYNAGEQSAPIQAVTTGKQATPAAADILVQKTAGSILLTGPDMEYSINGGAYSLSGTFIGLTPFTEYTISARRIAGGTLTASDPYVFKVTTEKGVNQIVPEVSAALVQQNTIVLKAVFGAEYSIDNGVTWQDSNTFTGLEENTSYAFIVRLKASGAYSAGEVSSAFSIATSKKPEASLSAGAGAGIGVGVTMLLAAVAIILIKFKKVKTPK